MKSIHTYRFVPVIATVAAGLVLMTPPVARGQGKAAPKAGATKSGAFVIPRTTTGKPDFSGIYEWPKALSGEACRCSATVFDRKLFAPLKPGGDAFYEKPTGDARHDEPRDFCMPAGFPSGMLSANAMQFFQSGNHLIMVHEFQRMTRVIPLDGRKHREDIEPSFYGDPVGHWDGETLVIETTNFKRWGLDDYYYTNPNEYRMHSDALKTTERLSWKGPATLTYTMTIDDPKIFTRAWSQEFQITSKPEWESTGLLEYICEENNRCPGGVCGGK